MRFPTGAVQGIKTEPKETAGVACTLPIAAAVAARALRAVNVAPAPTMLGAALTGGFHWPRRRGKWGPPVEGPH